MLSNLTPAPVDIPVDARKEDRHSRIQCIGGVIRVNVEHGERLLRTFENGSATVRVHVASPTYKTEIERQRRIDDFHRFLAALLVEDKRQQMQQTSVE